MIFYKGARPDGWDFHTGKTINYRDSIGSVVHVSSKSTRYSLCSDSVLHASREPIGVFIGSNIPLSLYMVEGEPVVEDGKKFGFKQMKVLEEVPSKDFPRLFGFEYEQVLHPLDPKKIGWKGEVSAEEIDTLKIWASVRDSVRDSVWASVWDSVWDSVRASVRASVWDSVWDSVWASVWASVRDSEAAYIGSIFSSVKEWKYTEKVKVEGYPFQSCVDLLQKGLVPVSDGRKNWWLIHPIDGKPAKVVWKGKLP